jgi:hydrogenase/urease accessory protein HupE
VKGSGLATIGPATLAITMIASFLLLGFGLKQALSRESRQRGLLMIACGIVFIANVLIWTI